MNLHITATNTPKKSLHSNNKYRGFGVKGICRDPHNLDVVLSKHLVETADQWMPKYSEKAECRRESEKPQSCCEK